MIQRRKLFYTRKITRHTEQLPQARKTNGDAGNGKEFQGKGPEETEGRVGGSVSEEASAADELQT